MFHLHASNSLCQSILSLSLRPFSQWTSPLTLSSLRAKGVSFPWLFNSDSPRLSSDDVLLPFNQIHPNELPFPANIGYCPARFIARFLVWKWTSTIFTPNQGPYTSMNEFLHFAQLAAKPALESLSLHPKNSSRLYYCRNQFSHAFYERLQHTNDTLSNIDDQLSLCININHVENPQLRARFALVGDKDLLLSYPSSNAKATSLGPLTMVTRSRSPLRNTIDTPTPISMDTVAIQIHLDVVLQVNGSVQLYRDVPHLSSPSDNSTLPLVIVDERFTNRDVVIRFASKPIGIREDGELVWQLWDVDYWIEAEMRDDMD